MKKNYFKILGVAFVLSLSVTSVFSQGAYVNVNAGYNFQMGSSEVVGLYNYSENSNRETEEQIHTSLGKGLNFGAAFGYMFTENIGAELGASYLLGSKTKASDTYSNGSTTDYEISANMLRINPSIVIAAGGEKLKPYAKVGVVFGFGSVKYNMTDKDAGDTEIMTMKLNGGVAIGLTSSLGATFDLSDKLALFGELNMINLSYAPTKGEMTEYTYNGADELSSLTTSEKEIEFVDSVTYDYNNPSSSSEPNKVLKERLPFGSLGLNVGVRFNI